MNGIPFYWSFYSETAIKNNWTYVVDIFMSFIFHFSSTVEIHIWNEILWFKNWFKFQYNRYMPNGIRKSIPHFLKFQVNYIGRFNLSNRFLKSNWSSVEYSIENENWNENKSDWEFILETKIGRRTLYLSVWRCGPWKCRNGFQCACVYYSNIVTIICACMWKCFDFKLYGLNVEFHFNAKC